MQEVEGMIRTPKSALEERLKEKIDSKNPIMPWMVEYAATLLNTYRVGKDQKTATERHKGSKQVKPVAEFGECVWFMPLDLKSHPVSTPDCRFQDGVWLGVDQRTSETIIGTPSGVVKSRTIKRKLEETRWEADEILGIEGVPWSPTPALTQILFRLQSEFQLVHRSQTRQFHIAMSRE